MYKANSIHSIILLFLRFKMQYNATFQRLIIYHDNDGHVCMLSLCFTVVFTWQCFLTFHLWKQEGILCFSWDLFLRWLPPIHSARSRSAIYLNNKKVKVVVSWSVTHNDDTPQVIGACPSSNCIPSLLNFSKESVKILSSLLYLCLSKINGTISTTKQTTLLDLSVLYLSPFLLFCRMLLASLSVTP